MRPFQLLSFVVLSSFLPTPSFGLERLSADVRISDEVALPEVAASRLQRFPSKEERLKVYMSNWFVPPCEGYSDGLITFQYNRSRESEWPTVLIYGPKDEQNATQLEFESIIEPDKAFFLDRETALDCARKHGSNDEKHFESRVLVRQNMKMYCSDVTDTLMVALDHVDWEVSEKDQTPTLLQFGDLKHSHVYRYLDLPHIKKFRSATTPRELKRVTAKECYSGPRDVLQNEHGINSFQPIIWKLATSRHYSLLDKVHREDTPWKEKIDMAVFRGQLTGSRDGYDKHKSDEENCLNLRRCRLVYRHANSTLINARLTSTRDRLPPVLNDVNLMARPVSIRKLLQFKGIVMLEGNDVASGLKWALLSQSVVLMPRPLHTSWALEELLEPWVHYVPLNENATDVEEKMQWVIENDEAAQRIAERGTLWMEDLVFHPDAAEDDRWIQEEIIRRYRTHFSPVQESQ